MAHTLRSAVEGARIVERGAAGDLNPDHVRGLQRTIGNRATSQLAAKSRAAVTPPAPARAAAPARTLAPSPSGLLDGAAAGPSTEVPFRAEMERFFGASFAAVRAYTDRHDALAPLNARGAARHGEMFFAEKSPRPWAVRHEAAHVMQYRLRGGSAGLAPDSVSRRHDAHESEARSLAGRSRGRARPLTPPTAAIALLDWEDEQDPVKAAAALAAELEELNRILDLQVEERERPFDIEARRKAAKAVDQRAARLKEASGIDALRRALLARVLNDDEITQALEKYRLKTDEKEKVHGQLRQVVTETLPHLATGILQRLRASGYGQSQAAQALSLLTTGNAGVPVATGNIARLVAAINQIPAPLITFATNMAVVFATSGGTFGGRLETAFRRSYPALASAVTFSAIMKGASGSGASGSGASGSGSGASWGRFAFAAGAAGVVYIGTSLMLAPPRVRGERPRPFNVDPLRGEVFFGGTVLFGKILKVVEQTESRYAVTVDMQTTEQLFAVRGRARLLLTDLDHFYPGTQDFSKVQIMFGGGQSGRYKVSDLSDVHWDQDFGFTIQKGTVTGPNGRQGKLEQLSIAPNGFLSGNFELGEGPMGEAPRRGKLGPQYPDVVELEAPSSSPVVTGAIARDSIAGEIQDWIHERTHFGDWSLKSFARASLRTAATLYQRHKNVAEFEKAHPLPAQRQRRRTVGSDTPPSVGLISRVSHGALSKIDYLDVGGTITRGLTSLKQKLTISHGGYPSVSLSGIEFDLRNSEDGRPLVALLIRNFEVKLFRGAEASGWAKILWLPFDKPHLVISGGIESENLQLEGISFDTDGGLSVAHGVFRMELPKFFGEDVHVEAWADWLHIDKKKGVHFRNLGGELRGLEIGKHVMIDLLALNAGAGRESNRYTAAVRARLLDILGGEFSIKGDMTFGDERPVEGALSGKITAPLHMFKDTLQVTSGEVTVKSHDDKLSGEIRDVAAKLQFGDKFVLNVKGGFGFNKTGLLDANLEGDLAVTPMEGLTISGKGEVRFNHDGLVPPVKFNDLLAKYGDEGIKFGVREAVITSLDDFDLRGVSFEFNTDDPALSKGGLWTGIKSFLPSWLTQLDASVSAGVELDIGRHNGKWELGDQTYTLKKAHLGLGDQLDIDATGELKVIKGVRSGYLDASLVLDPTPDIHLTAHGRVTFDASKFQRAVFDQIDVESAWAKLTVGTIDIVDRANFTVRDIHFTFDSKKLPKGGAWSTIADLIPSWLKASVEIDARLDVVRRGGEWHLENQKYQANEIDVELGDRLKFEGNAELQPGTSGFLKGSFKFTPIDGLELEGEGEIRYEKPDGFSGRLSAKGRFGAIEASVDEVTFRKVNDIDVRRVRLTLPEAGLKAPLLGKTPWKSAKSVTSLVGTMLPDWISAKFTEISAGFDIDVRSEGVEVLRQSYGLVGADVRVGGTVDVPLIHIAGAADVEINEQRQKKGSVSGDITIRPSQHLKLTAAGSFNFDHDELHEAELHAVALEYKRFAATIEKFTFKNRKNFALRGISVSASNGADVSDENVVGEMFQSLQDWLGIELPLTTKIGLTFDAIYDGGRLRIEKARPILEEATLKIGDQSLAYNRKQRKLAVGFATEGGFGVDVIIPVYPGVHVSIEPKFEYGLSGKVNARIDSDDAKELKFSGDGSVDARLAGKLSLRVGGGIPYVFTIDGGVYGKVGVTLGGKLGVRGHLKWPVDGAGGSASLGFSFGVGGKEHPAAISVSAGLTIRAKLLMFSKEFDYEIGNIDLATLEAYGGIAVHKEKGKPVRVAKVPGDIEGAKQPSDEEEEPAEVLAAGKFPTYSLSLHPKLREALANFKTRVLDQGIKETTLDIQRRLYKGMILAQRIRQAEEARRSRRTPEQYFPAERDIASVGIKSAESLLAQAKKTEDPLEIQSAQLGLDQQTYKQRALTFGGSMFHALPTFEEHLASLRQRQQKKDVTLIASFGTLYSRYIAKANLLLVLRAERGQIESDLAEATVRVRLFEEPLEQEEDASLIFDSELARDFWTQRVKDLTVALQEKRAEIEKAPSSVSTLAGGLTREELAYLRQAAAKVDAQTLTNVLPQQQEKAKLEKQRVELTEAIARRERKLNAYREARDLVKARDKAALIRKTQADLEMVVSKLKVIDDLANEMMEALRDPEVFGKPAPKPRFPTPKLRFPTPPLSSVTSILMSPLHKPSPSILPELMEGPGALALGMEMPRQASPSSPKLPSSQELPPSQEPSAGDRPSSVDSVIDETANKWAKTPHALAADKLLVAAEARTLAEGIMRQIQSGGIKGPAQSAPLQSPSGPPTPKKSGPEELVESDFLTRPSSAPPKKPATQVEVGLSVTGKSSIAIGETAQLAATVSYDDDSNSDVTTKAQWTSDKPTVATVDSAGKVAGVAEGTAEITATSNIGRSLTAAKKIVVAAAPSKSSPPLGVGLSGRKPAWPDLPILPPMSHSQPSPAVIHLPKGSSAKVEEPAEIVLPHQIPERQSPPPRAASAYEVLRRNAGVVAEVPTVETHPLGLAQHAPVSASGLRAIQSHLKGYDFVKASLRSWLSSAGLEVVRNGGLGSQSCLVISLLQHATRDYRTPAAKDVEAFKQELGVGENDALEPTSDAVGRLLVALNRRYNRNMKVVYVMATRDDPPYVLLEGNIGAEPVVVWDQLGHFEPVKMA